MRFTAGALNRATLARQLLLAREPLPVADAVRRVVALQAQSPPSPYLALWNRIAGFDPADLDAAFADRTVLKASLLRITLHAVVADDYPTFQHAVVDLLRAARLNDDRFRETGLTTEDADGVMSAVLKHTRTPRTNAEMETWLEARYGRPVPRLWWALRHYAPVVHAPTGAPWAFGERAAYVTAPTRPPTGDPRPSVTRLVRRVLEGFGPATAADIARLTFLRAPVVTAALHALTDVERHDGPTRAPLYDLPGLARPDEDTDAPARLLGMWDLTLLAYTDRGRMMSDADGKLVVRRNGDVLPTLLVDGHVAGVWRPVAGGIEATAFRKLPRRAWQALAAEAHDLVGFLAGRDPDVYRRYTHWWKQLDGAEVRVLAG